MSSWGRGTYGQHGSAVEQILAQMAEQARRDEEMQRQQEFQKAQSDRQIQGELLASYIRNPNAQTYSALTASGMMGDVQVPQYQPSAREQYVDRFWGNVNNAPEGPLNIDPVAAGLADPEHLASAKPFMDVVGQRYNYAAPQGALPPHVVEAQLVQDKLAMNADEREKARQWGEEFTKIKMPESDWKNKLTGAQIGEANASAADNFASAGKHRAETVKIGEETTNIKGERDANSPLFKGQKPGPSYKDQTKERVAVSAADLLSRTNANTVGPLGLIQSKIAGTDAYNYGADLDTLKSNIAFGALQEMREASKTGGALGQVSDKETALLQATLGAIKQGQSPASMKKNLKKIQDSVERWEAAKSGKTGTTGTWDASGGGVVRFDASGRRIK